MAWNTEETRRRLKDAATHEFAEHGLHGTTVDRIARRAGVNKERLYNYFGGKEQLFGAVLSDELAKVAAAVPVLAGDREDIGEWAGRVFDYQAERPQLSRLLRWEALAYGPGPVPDEAGRGGHYRDKVDALAAARLGGPIDPAHLVCAVLALAHWWTAFPQLARMITGAEPDDPAETARRRAVVVAAVRQLVRD